MESNLSQHKLNEEVEVTCYRKKEKKTRKEALQEFYRGMMCSEGSEHERYETIFFQLLAGYTECSDEIPFYAI